jgi:hypothetical protein
MNREQRIDILKNGFNVQNLGRKFISYGQLDPEFQAVALTIPNDCFEYFRPDGTFAPNDVSPLRKHITYKLVADYMDKPKELEIKPPLIIVNIEEGLVNFDSSQGGILPEMAIKIALEILEKSTTELKIRNVSE